MLRPPPLTAAQYGAAVNRPLQGYERRLLVSLEQIYEVGSYEILGLNSGTYTANYAESQALSADPRELLVVLDTGVDGPEGGTIALTINGKDEANADQLNKAATIQAPTWSSETRGNFPRGYAAEVVVTEGKKWKSISSITVAAGATYANARLLVLAVPPLSTFRLISCRTDLEFTRKTQAPFPIQCGIDEGRFIKPGNISVGNLSVSAKIFNGAEGLARINGQRVTGLLKDLKEDIYLTQHVFLKGLIISGNESAPEGAEPASFSAQGMFEVSASLLAG